jgi:hypothetical protein
MSASPPKADIAQHRPHVCFVPESDIARSLSDKGGSVATTTGLISLDGLPMEWRGGSLDVPTELSRSELR